MKLFLFAHLRRIRSSAVEVSIGGDHSYDIGYLLG
jgi:hypothetical protein